MDQPFKDHYCPCCLCQVNPVTGDHWDFCEYEASFGDWVNPRQPLTKTEMLKEGLLRTEDELKKNRKYGRELQKRIASIKKLLEERVRDEQ